MLSKIIVQTYLHNLGMEEELQGVGDEEELEQSCPLQLCLEGTQSGCMCWELCQKLAALGQAEQHQENIILHQ